MKENNLPKVLFIIRRLNNCGPVNQLLERTKVFMKQNLDFSILTIDNEIENSRLDEFLETGVDVISLHGLKTKGKDSVKLLKRQLESKYDIIHSSGIRANHFSSSLDTRKIILAENFVFDDYILQFGKIFGFVLSIYELYLMRKSKSVLTCSNALQKKYKKYLKSENLYTIQNCVDSNRFLKLDTNVEDLRKKLNIKPAENIFLTIGLLDRKQPEIILNAFLSSNKFHNSILIVVGSYAEFSEIHNKYSINENIIFTGSIKNVEEYLWISNYYISASKSEGLPTAVIEAGVAGCELLLSNIEQHRELTDFLELGYSHFDHSSIDGLIELLNDLPSKFDFSNSATISSEYRKRFDMNVIARKYIDYYVEIGGEVN